jgi:molybdopterin synthase catalytic subunit
MNIATVHPNAACFMTSPEPRAESREPILDGPRILRSVPTPLLAIGPGPLELERIAASLASGAGQDAGVDGAVVTFLGLVRGHNLGRRVRYLEYESYEPLALKAFERIAAEIATRWPDTRLALHHRVGRLAIGEASVAIAARSPHRANAYAACRYAIERVKQIAPIWKREFFEGGDVWIEGATADPDAADARTEAERIACT